MGKCKSRKQYHALQKRPVHWKKRRTKIHNITLEQNFEANPRIPIEEKLEADDDFEKTDIGDRLRISDEDNTLLEDLKPSLDTLQESLSSARLKLSECNFEYICRLCGTELSEEECALSDNDVFCYNYAEKISSCTSLEVVRGDGLPHKMCVHCITNLNMAYDFRNVCIETYNILSLSSLKKEIISGDSKAETTEIAHEEPTTSESGSLLCFDAELKKYNPPILRARKEEARFSSPDSNKNLTPVEEDKEEDYLEDNTDSFFEQNKNEDIEKTTGYPSKAETVGALGSCDDINKTETHNDIGPTHSDDGNWWEDQLEERETKKTLFMLSYPMNTKKNINIAKKEIQKVCCPKLKCSDMEVLCPFCPAMFDAEQYYEIQEHLDSHIRIKQENVCRYENCNETFTSYAARNIHQLTDHGTQKLVPRKWLCEHCAMMVRPCYYKRHNEKKKKNRPRKVYLCDECPFRTDDKSRISPHIEGVHNFKRIRCKLCDKMVPLNKVQYHITNKHEAKIPCKYCNKEFLRRNINGHLRTHTGEKPFPCSDCGMEFTFRVSLKNHRKRHHGDDMFKGTT